MHQEPTPSYRRSQIELKNKYKYRLILDESWSFGVVGKTGRGVTEVFDVPAAAVDMLMGSMASSLAAGGGFCAGSREVVMHQVRSPPSTLTRLSPLVLIHASSTLQRINSPASVFSASLPPLLAVSASEALALLSTSVTSTNPAHPLASLPANVRALRTILDQIPTIEILSAEISPLIHLMIKPSTLDALHKAASDGGVKGRARSHSNVSHPPPQPIVVQPAPGAVGYPSTLARGLDVEARLEAQSAREEQERLLQEIVDAAAENGVLLSTTKRNWAQEMVELRPSIRICITSGLTKKEVEKAGAVVKSAVAKVLGKGKK